MNSNHWLVKLLPIIVPGITALIGAAIGALIAPWVNWGVEKHRARHAQRRALIKDLRDALDRVYDREEFRDSPLYSAIRPFLRREVSEQIDVSGVQITRRVEIGAGDKQKRALLEEISRIERDWDLL